MFAFLVSASLKVRLLVVAIAAVAMIYGGSAVRDLQIDVLPDLNKGLVTILTEAPGLAPEEVEVLVTYPIESAMNGANGVTRVRSVSTTGLSIIYVEFAWDTNIFVDRQIVAERLAPVQLDLPTGVQPLIAPISSIMGEIELVAMSSSTVDPMDLREIANWVVAPRLRAVPGVSRVVPIGGLVKEYRVTLDNLRMSQLKVSFNDIVAALQAYGANTGGGFVNQGTQEFLIRNLARTQSLEDLRNVAVEERDGQPILLRQLADISFEPKQRRGDAGFMGGPAVVLSIQKQPQADTVALTAAVDLVLDDLQKTMPQGTIINQRIFRQADFIHAAVDNLEEVLIEAIAAVAVILFLFLFNVRTTIISLVAIPVSVLTTFVVFRWMGLTVNTMTLGGLAIAIGELVDDAVVDVENIFRRLRQNKARVQPRPAMEVIVAASQEVRSSIVYSTIIITLVFVPLFALPGIEGRLFAPLGISYIVSILASLITSITLTPVLCSYLLPQAKTLAEGESAVVRFAKRINSWLLARALDRPRLVLAVIAVGVLAASSVVPSLPRAFLPPFNEGSLVITMTLEPGISLDESTEIAKAVEGILLNVPEVTTVGRRTGRSEADEHANGVHVTDFEVGLIRTGRRLPFILADIRSRLAGIPAFFNIGQPITHRLVDHILTGVAAEVVIKVFGNDLDTLRSIAHQVEASMRTIPGLVDVQVEKQVPVPQIQIQTDAAARCSTACSRRNGASPGGADQWRQDHPDHRRLQALRSGGAARRYRAYGRAARLAADRYAGGQHTGVDGREDLRDQRAQPGAARKQPAPHPGDGERRRLEQQPDRPGDPAGDGLDPFADRLLHDLRRSLCRAEPVDAEGRRPRLDLAVARLRHSLHALPVGRAGRDRHGQRTARPDRRRDRDPPGRPQPVDRDHRRLRNPHRHQHPERHPQDKPLH
jgi:HME family heavy-metal exporter